jgi:undecaprenyl-diphosphatase
MHSTPKNYAFERTMIVVIMVISLLLFLVTAEMSVSPKLNLVDETLFHFCHLFNCPFNTKLAIIVSFFGTGTFLIPAYLPIIYVLMKSSYEKYAAFVVTIITSSLLSGWLLKAIFHRHRPIMPLVHGAGWYSFPSGHALGAYTFSGVCLFLIWKLKTSEINKRMLSILFIAFGMAVGLSRIYLQVHFATDVIGSLFFSAF